MFSLVFESFGWIFRWVVGEVFGKCFGALWVESIER
jgi:hypothetical protein